MEISVKGRLCKVIKSLLQVIIEYTWIQLEFYNNVRFSCNNVMHVNFACVKRKKKKKRTMKLYSLQNELKKVIKMPKTFHH